MVNGTFKPTALKILHIVIMVSSFKFILLVVDMQHKEYYDLNEYFVLSSFFFRTVRQFLKTEKRCPQGGEEKPI